MPTDRHPPRLDRSQLPEEFTPETVRAMGFRVARRLANPNNGLLTPTEQREFDAALRAVMQSSTDRLGRSFGQQPPPGQLDLDPELRRSYQRTKQRLEAQAERARRAFPQLTDDWKVEVEAPPAVEAVDEVDSGEVDPGDDVSIGTFEAEITQTSDMMDILEQIAGIQQQQLEHQRSQLLGETRGVFFALAVSVAVIIAGVAPLVEASSSDRWLILAWTAGVCVVAGGVYALVRAVQQRAD